MSAFVRIIAIIGCMVSPALAIELPAELFLNLKSEQFRQREAAQAGLLSWARERPDVAMDELFRQTRSADDPEVRERCLAILRELVNDEYLKEGKGYIGIRMQDELANVPGDPVPRGAIRVIGVVADSAAQRGGLLINDLIVALNDQIWRDGGASLPFGEKIREMKPNTKITLKVLRNGALLDVEMKLGRRPVLADDPFLNQREDDIEAAEKASKAEFFRRWIERKKAAN